MSLFPNLSGAVFGDGNNPDSAYRYTLWRTPDPSNLRTMAVIGCNPSTATATEDDPTIRRCIRFALDSGHGRLVMLNCFAFRATDVRVLKSVVDPVGPENVDHAIDACKDATVVCAWGSTAKLPNGWRNWPALFVAKLRPSIPGLRLHVLRHLANRDPEHPLYLPASCRPIPWTP